VARRSCVFCGARPVTREHVIPRWLTRMLPSGDTLREMVVREVCAGCNHGWLHDLERSFRAVMQPALGQTVYGISLGQGSQTVVATWAVKTWALAELARPDEAGGRGLDTRPLLRALRQLNEPPPHARVWIGAVTARTDHLVSVHTRPVLNEHGEWVGVFTGLQIGALLLVIFAAVIGPDPEFRLGLNSPALDQMWPHQTEEVRWPPPPFSLADLDREFPSGKDLVVP
jgi:hypothetical protein